MSQIKLQTHWYKIIIISVEIDIVDNDVSKLYIKRKTDIVSDTTTNE